MNLKLQTSSEQNNLKMNGKQLKSNKTRRKKYKKQQNSLLAPKECPTAESTKEVVPLLMKRERFIGPAVRLRKRQNNRIQYQVINRRTVVSKVETDKSNRNVVMKRLKLENEQTNDTSWKCSLCHLGSNVKSLGILYGPYDLGVVNPEAWFHEDCVVWSTNVHVIGTRIVNLRTLVEDALKTSCTWCGSTGATIGCFIKHCTHYPSIHYPCAREVHCVLDETNFTVYCSTHAAQLGRKAGYIL